MGFAFALFGVLVLVYVIGRYLIQGGSVPGFPFLASTIAIFSGVQLFALGIIGEYLARMHFRLQDKPPYVVGEVTGAPAGHGSCPGWRPGWPRRGPPCLTSMLLAAVSLTQS